MSEQRRARRITEQIDRLRDQLESAGESVRRDKYSVLLAAANWIEEMLEKGAASRDRGADAPSTSGSLPDYTPRRNENLDYHHVFVHSGAAQAIASVDGSFLDCNRLFTALLGFSPAEVRAQSIFTLTPAEEFRHMFALMGDMMQSKAQEFAGGSVLDDLGTLVPSAEDWNGNAEAIQFQKLCKTKGGALLDVVVHMALVRDAAGDPLYFTCTVLPVEKALQRSLLEEYERIGGLILHTGESSVAQAAFREVSRDFRPPDLPHLASVNAGPAPLAAPAFPSAAQHPSPQAMHPSPQAMHFQMPSAKDDPLVQREGRRPDHAVAGEAMPSSWYHAASHGAPDPWSTRPHGFPSGGEHATVSPQAQAHASSASSVLPTRNGNGNGASHVVAVPSPPVQQYHRHPHQQQQIHHPPVEPVEPMTRHLYHNRGAVRGAPIRAGSVPVNRGIGIHPPQVHHSSVEPPAGSFLGANGTDGAHGLLSEQYFSVDPTNEMGIGAPSSERGGGSSSGSLGRTAYWDRPPRRAETDSSSNRSIRRASKLDILLGEGARSLTSDIPRSVAYDPLEGEGGKSFVSIGTIPDIRDTLSGLQQLSEREVEQHPQHPEVEHDIGPESAMPPPRN